MPIVALHPNLRRGNTRVILALVACVVATVGLWIWTFERDAPNAPLNSAPASTDPGAAQRDELVDVPRLEAERTIASASTQASAPATATPELPAHAPPPSTAESVHARGFVLDTSGMPVANVGIRLQEEVGDTVRAISGGDGSFELTLERPAGTLVAAGDRFATVRASVVKKGDSGERYLVIVAPAVDVSGSVVDETDRAVAGAALSIDVPMKKFAGFPRALDTTEAMHLTTRSDASGRFEFRSAPGASVAAIGVSAEGYDRGSFPVPTESRHDVKLVLHRAADSARVVTGIVFEDGTQPSAGAVVRLGEDATSTDANGRFRLQLGEWTNAETPLIAVKHDRQPAVVPMFGALVQPGEPMPPEQRLFLGGAPLSITGRLLRANEEPAPDWTVVLVDGTNATPGTVPTLLAETLAAGSSEEPPKTDSHGRFTMLGLSARAYRLRCFDTRTLISFESKPVEAGSRDVILRVPPDALWSEVRGRVRAPDGAGIGNVRVTITLITARDGGSWMSTAGTDVTTDARGAFTLQDVPHHWTYLNLTGEAIIPTRFDLDDADPSHEIAITASRRCHFSFESTAAAAERPDALRLVDEDGQFENVMSFQGNGWTSSSYIRLTDGKSLVLSASEGAKAIVLYREMREIGRVPTKLVPGDVQIVRK